MIQTAFLRQAGDVMKYLSHADAVVIYVERERREEREGYLLNRSTIGFKRILIWHELMWFSLNLCHVRQWRGLFRCPYPESGWSSCASEWKQLSQDQLLNPQLIQTGHMCKWSKGLISCMFFVWSKKCFGFSFSEALQHKWSWPTLYILSKRNIWVTVGNMKIFHLVLPILQRAGKLINSLHICIKSFSVVQQIIFWFTQLPGKVVSGRWCVTDNVFLLYQ